MRNAIALALTFGLCVSTVGPVFAHQHHRSTTHSVVQQSMMPTAPELKLVKTLKGEDSYSILRPSFSRDGKYLAAELSTTKTIRIWNVSTGEVLADIPPTLLYGDSRLVDGLEFTPDGKQIIAMCGNNPLKVIDWQDQKVSRTIDLGLTASKIEDYKFTPDYQILAIASANGVDVWNFSKGEKIAHFLDGQHVNALDISRDGQKIAFGTNGSIEHSVGILDLATKTVENYPLVKLSDDQIKMVPNYQVRHVAFEGNNRLLVGYMALPEGAFKPTGPAGVFLADLSTGQVIGPKPLSSDMLSFDPVTLGQPFNTTFVNTFVFGAQKTASAADFLSPNLNKVKTLTDADLNSPMLTFRVSPDQKWMAGSFKQPDGKVQMRLYELLPQKMDATTSSMN